MHDYGSTDDVLNKKSHNLIALITAKNDKIKKPGLLVIEN